MVQITQHTRAADIILAHPLAINVFERLQIPLGVQEKNLLTLSQENNLSENLIINLLYITIYGNPPTQNPLQFSDAAAIIEYLLTSHQFYSLEASPAILKLIREAAAAGANENMLSVERFFQKYCHEIEIHFNYEKDVVFPYIRQLAAGQLSHQAPSYSVKLYRHQHTNIEQKLSDLQNLLVKYLPPTEPYRLRRALFQQISSLGNDLNIHARIENEILVPLVEKEEEQWNS